MKKWIKAATDDPSEVQKIGNANVKLGDIIDCTPTFIDLVKGFKPPNDKGEILSCIELQTKGRQALLFYNDIDETGKVCWVIIPVDNGIYVYREEATYYNIEDACSDFSDEVWNAFNKGKFSQIEIRQFGNNTYFY